MKNTEIVGIIIVVILLIVFAVNLWINNRGAAGQTTSAKDACDATCIQIDEDNWSSPLAGANNFLTKEECVSNCEVRIK